MADRKPFLLRIDRDVLDAVHRWADDDLRSVNGQIEFVLRAALKRAGRKPGMVKHRHDVAVRPGVQADAQQVDETDLAIDAESDA